MGKYVEIKFQFFEVCCLGEDGDEELYDLKLWIEETNPKSFEDKVLDVKGIKCRLEDFVLRNFAGTDFYGMRFMRMEESSNTYKIKEKTAAEHIDLEDDEYIGRSTVALYDPKLHVLMVQMNRNGIGVSSIEEYINITMGKKEDEEQICYLRPILNPLELGGLKKRRIMKLDVRFSNIKGYKATEKSLMEKVLAGFDELDGVTAHIEIGLGRTKKKSLNNDTISGIVSEIRDNRECVSSAKVKLSDDQKSNLYDLFDNALHSFIRFYIESRKEIEFNDMIRKMAEKYKEGARIYIMSERRKR